MLTVMPSGVAVKIAGIGNEGVADHFGFLGLDASPTRLLVHGERLRTSAHRYGNELPVSIVGRTVTDGRVRNDTALLLHGHRHMGVEIEHPGDHLRMYTSNGCCVSTVAFDQRLAWCSAMAPPPSRR